MLHRYINSILQTVLILILIFIASYIVASVILISQANSFGYAILPVTTQNWWFSYSTQKINLDASGWSLGIGFVILLCCAMACYQLKNIYKRISSPEILFYLFFIFSFSFETLRIWSAFLLLKNLSFSYSLGVLLSRSVYLGRFFGLLSLLISSLYAVDINYHKYNLVLLMLFLLAFTLAFVVPFDSSVVLSNFLFKLGDEMGIALVSMSLMFFSLATFVIAGIRKNNRDYLLIALATLIILLGQNLLFFSLALYLIIPGVILFIAGLLMFRHFVDKPFF